MESLSRSLPVGVEEPLFYPHVKSPMNHGNGAYTTNRKSSQSHIFLCVVEGAAAWGSAHFTMIYWRGFQTYPHQVSASGISFLSRIGSMTTSNGVHKRSRYK